MGILSKLMGMSSGKESLVRRLLKERVSKDPKAAELGQGPEIVDAMSAMTLLGLPEASIVTCVESWAKLKRAGQSDPVIAKRIAEVRGGAAGGMSVEEVIRDRVHSEHGHSGYLPVEHVDWCIEESKMFYGIR